MAVVDEQKNFIQIHIFRTGGTSIHRVLDPHMKHHVLGYHCSALHLKQWLTQQGEEDFWNNAYKFSMVRNPYDWQVSVYEFIRAGGEYRDQVLPLSFHQYLEWYARMMQKGTFGGLGSNYFYTQKQALTDENGKILVDFVGRFENLKKDFEVIKKRLGLTVPLPHANKTVRKPLKHYYLHKATRQYLYDLFKEDFEMFGYNPHHL
jgi:hypothetical protein